MPTIFNIFKNVLVKELKVSEEFIFLVEKGGGVVILVLPFVFFVCNNITNQICTVKSNTLQMTYCGMQARSALLYKTEITLKCQF